MKERLLSDEREAAREADIPECLKQNGFGMEQTTNKNPQILNHL